MSAMKICPQCGTEYELDQRFCPKDGSTLKSQSNPSGDLLGQIIADRYNVMKKLGEGGMGTVYLAEHVKMGRRSALKVMNPGMVNDADAISRFNREAANASRINHPNVAAVYDFGETSEGMIYLAMEFIEGPSLTNVIDDLGALPPLRAADITRQAAEALAVAHDMGIVHRDLKPDNIMLAKGRDGQDIVKVVDFGIAKAANNEAQKVTKTGMVVGTPEYMSPEQLAGDKLDGRSDTYSLALVAFNMMTGKLPFPAETIQESMVMRLTDSARPLAEMKPDVAWSPEVQAVLDRALARPVDERYQSASDFGRELYQAVAAMPHVAITTAGTAVMSPVAGTSAVPAKAATPAKPATPPGAVPPTRVNPATPQQPAAAVPAGGAKSRMPMLVAAGVAALLIVGGGGYVVNQMMAADSTGPQNFGTQSGTANPSQASLPTAAPALNLDRELHSIAGMPDIEAAENRAILLRLAPLDSLARLAADSTLLHFRYLRSRALFGSGDVEAGCDSLSRIERLVTETRFENASQSILSICRQR